MAALPELPAPTRDAIFGAYEADREDVTVDFSTVAPPTPAPSASPPAQPTGGPATTPPESP